MMKQRRLCSERFSLMKHLHHHRFVDLLLQYLLGMRCNNYCLFITFHIVYVTLCNNTFNKYIFKNSSDFYSLLACNDAISVGHNSPMVSALESETSVLRSIPVIIVHYVDRQYALIRWALWTGKTSYLWVSGHLWCSTIFRR